MNKIKFRIVCLALAALVLLPVLGGCASSKKSNFSLPTRTLVSEEVKYFGSFGYQVYDDGSVMVVEYTGNETRVTVPESIEGGKVVALGNEVFADNTTLQSVKMTSVEVIGHYAFYNCPALSEVTLSKKLWSVGVSAFETTPWLATQTDEFVVVGDGVLLKYQGSDLYVVLPENVKHLSNAFEVNEQIIGVELGEQLLTIGSNAFAMCTALRYVEFGSNLKLIGDSAFDTCEMLTSVIIPDSVEVLGGYAFNYCTNISQLRIGKSVRTIGDSAFRNCIRMKVLELPGTVESIGTYGFADCLVLTLVYYGGTPEQFEALGLDTTNYILRDVEKIYAQ